MAKKGKLLELYGVSTDFVSPRDLSALLSEQQCPFLGRKCIKVRKSQPNISIGSCSVATGAKTAKRVAICPFRLLEKKQIFTDCFQLLLAHERGNEIHVVPEVGIPGGSVDYFLISASKDLKVRDFVGIELQTLDTTGTVWPVRQRFLASKNCTVETADVESTKSFGMNWKMTAKTILVQLHHKIQTFEHINKKLVLVLQDHLLDYMCREFSFSHFNGGGNRADPMHFHSYRLEPAGSGYRLEFDRAVSTDEEGIAKCLNLQANARVELAEIVRLLESKLSVNTLLNIESTSVFAPSAEGIEDPESDIPPDQESDFEILG